MKILCGPNKNMLSLFQMEKKRWAVHISLCFVVLFFMFIIAALKNDTVFLSVSRCHFFVGEPSVDDFIRNLRIDFVLFRCDYVSLTNMC